MAELKTNPYKTRHPFSTSGGRQLVSQKRSRLLSAGRRVHRDIYGGWCSYPSTEYRSHTTVVFYRRKANILWEGFSIIIVKAGIEIPRSLWTITKKKQQI